MVLFASQIFYYVMYSFVLIFTPNNGTKQIKVCKGDKSYLRGI